MPTIFLLDRSFDAVCLRDDSLAFHLPAFSANPFPKVDRAVFERDVIRFANGKKPDCIAVYECYVFQIHGDVTASPFQLKEVTEFVNIPCLYSAT
jgi:hypothetical protein